MSVAITKIKTRIKTVTGAYKVTSAMKLVSAVKLKKWKNKMLTNRDYSNKVFDITRDVFSYCEDIDNKYLLENSKTNKNLYIIVTSSLGLCGSYNSNIFKYADNVVTSDDDLIVLGGKGQLHFQNGANLIRDFDNYQGIQDISLIKSLTQFINNSFINGKYRSIKIISTMFKNSLAYIPIETTILPIIKQSSSVKKLNPPLFEPSLKDIQESLVPMYLKTCIYSKLLEAEVSEQGSRNNAMENATNNANEILDKLQIDYNKARQASITQEIIEIVGASKDK